MLLSDIQPHYFPRLHYVARMLASDIFVIRDDVQFVRNHKYPDGTRGVSHQAHTPIRTSDGLALLSVSIQKNKLLPINKTRVSYEPAWERKHLNVLRNSYHKSPNFAALFPEIESLIQSSFVTIAELNIATICWAVIHVLGVDQISSECLSLDYVNKLLKKEQATRLQRIVLGSAYLNPDTEESLTASKRIVELCQTFGAEEYLAGGTAFQAYLQTDCFESYGIKIRIQDWKCPLYPQQFTQPMEFIPNLSIIDLLMNSPVNEVAGMLAEAEVAL